MEARGLLRYWARLADGAGSTMRRTPITYVEVMKERTGIELWGKVGIRTEAEGPTGPRAAQR